jgi:hypothetical protein
VTHDQEVYIVTKEERGKRKEERGKRKEERGLAGDRAGRLGRLPRYWLS